MKANPRRVERCSRCKSRKWNDDDPKATLKKRRLRPKTDKDLVIAKRRKAESEQLNAADRQIRAENRTQRKIEAGKIKPDDLAMCVHRMRKIDCPLCKKK
jgi:hypothetical protein